MNSLQEQLHALQQKNNQNVLNEDMIKLNTPITLTATPTEVGTNPNNIKIEDKCLKDSSFSTDVLTNMYKAPGPFKQYKKVHSNSRPKEKENQRYRF